MTKETLAIRGGSKRHGTIQPGEEKLQEDLSHVYKYLMKGVKKLKSVSFLGCSVTGLKAKGACVSTRMEDKNTLLIGNQIV